MPLLPPWCTVDIAFIENVKNGDITVEKYIAEEAKRLGAEFSIAKFARLEKGEGLQKREDNFADEVASMVK